MKTQERRWGRRPLLAVGAATALAWATWPWTRTASGQSAQQGVTIQAREVPKLPEEPGDGLWQQAQPETVPMNPQNLVLPRVAEAGTKTVQVRALYDAERVGFLLEWQDPGREVTLGTVTSFRDAVAVMFPTRGPETLPAFTMGGPGAPVTIYHWKSDWQYGRLYDADEAYPNMAYDAYPFSGKGPGEMAESEDYAKKGDKVFVPAWWAGSNLANPELQARTTVEKLRAEGFGTLEPEKDQDGRGNGAWENGRWRTVISVPRDQPDTRLDPEAPIPVAFATWDGARQERNGQKAYSTWHALSLAGRAPAPATARGTGILVPLASGIGGVLVAGAIAIIGLRIWRARREAAGRRRDR